MVTSGGGSRVGGGYKYVSECGVGVDLSGIRIGDKLGWGGEVRPMGGSKRGL